MLATLSALIVSALFAAGCTASNGTGASTDVNDPEAPPATAPNGAPSFALPEDPGAQIRASGLRELPDDAEVIRSRVHVAVIINDFPVEVPAGIGVTPNGSSPLSTTDTDGIVIIQTEVPEGADDTAPTYTLGQLFTEWGVRLDKTCVAAYCSDESHQLLGWVNGQLVGDPASIALVDLDQVVVWFGPRDVNPAIPASHDFPTDTTP